MAVISDSGRVLEKVSLRTRVQQGREAVVRDLCETVRGLEKKFRGQGALAGIGIGVPGILYLKTGTLRQSPNLPGWENYPVRETVEALVGMRVWLDNDANVAALGEKWLGVGRDAASLCMLTLGTGVGGGLILDGRIWHGSLGMAGELGHMVVAENGAHCACGGRGCLETEASASAIVRKGREVLAADRSAALARATKQTAQLSAELIYRTAQAGDNACREIFDSVGKYLGFGIASLINALNLPLYVIGGGAAEAWDMFAPAMFHHLRERSYIFCEGSTRVEKSVLGGDAGLYGAAYLAFQSGSESQQDLG